MKTKRLFCYIGDRLRVQVEISCVLTRRAIFIIHLYRLELNLAFSHSGFDLAEQFAFDFEVRKVDSQSS